MKRIKQQAILEAVLFASGDPVPVSRLCELFDMPKDAVCKLVHSLRDTLDEAGSALAVLVLDNAVQLVTRSEFAPYIKQALSIARSAPLSQAAMEVLAIAAYNQPVTKSFIEQVRGVDSSSTVNSLVQKGLLEEAGRLDLPGKPISYKTTSVFLRSFQLSSLADLPPLQETKTVPDSAQAE